MATTNRVKVLDRIRHYPRLGLVVLAYVAFVALGMPDGLFGVAWPSIRATFSVPLDAAGLLIASSVAGYMTSSFLNGPIVARAGIGRTLAVSCAMTGTALIGYTLVPEWWMMVLLGTVSGLGAGAIDAGLNTYVAANFGEGLMQWLHASYGVGVTLGPIIMTTTLASLHSWQAGYRIVGATQIALAACFLLTLPMWRRQEAATGLEEPPRLTDYRTPLGETLRQPRVWLSMFLFFLYVGAEVSLGTWTYSLLVESRGIDPTAAGLWAGSYWATFTVGRVLAGLYAGRVGVDTLVMGSVAGALLGAGLLVWNPIPAANLAAVALIGFAIAPIFPALTSGTSRRVGVRFAANTIGMQMTMTGLGGATISGLMGVLARRLSLEVVPICLLTLFLALMGLYRWSMISGKGEGQTT